MHFGQTEKRLATVTAGKMARTWSLQSGQLEIELPHPAPLTHGVLCGKNDGRLLTITSEPKIRLWDLSRRQLLKEIETGLVEERFPVGRKILRSRDRSRVAINVRSNAVGVLDTDTGEWILPPQNRPQEIRVFAFSEDGRLLASGAGIGIQVQDVVTREAAMPPITVTGLEALRFSEDGQWLAIATEKGSQILNTRTGVGELEINTRALEFLYVGNTNELVLRDHSGEPLLFDFHTGKNRGSPFGQLAIPWHEHEGLGAILFRDKGADRAQLLDAATGVPRFEPFYHDGWIGQQRIHPNGKIVATRAQDRTARIWSVQTQRAEPLTLTLPDPVWEAQWNATADKILSTAIHDGRTELRLWNGHTGESLVTHQLQETIFLAAWAPDGSRFATGAQEGTVRIWNGNTGKLITDSPRHSAPPQALTFSPDSKVLATAAADNSVRLWDGLTGAPLGVPLLYTNMPLRVAFSHDSKRLVSTCEGGTIRVSSVPEGKLLLGPLQHDGACWAGAFSPDGRSLVSSSSDGTARLWDSTSGQPFVPPMRHESSVFWAAFSPNGQAIATSTDSGLARVWDVATGKMTAGPMRHPGRIWTVRWSPDGQFLATICTDGKARIWHAASGRLVAEPFAHEKEVRRVQFSPDMQRLLTSAFDGKIKIWDLTCLRPPMPAPDWLPELAEALGGKRIDKNDAPETVPGDSFPRVRDRLARASMTNDYYRAWANWKLNGRPSAPMASARP
jgi:WD40 repeat protein